MRDAWLRRPARRLREAEAATGAARHVKQPALADDPHWYKDAIIYQLHVKAFHDSTGDGIGDFAGLTAEAGLHRQPGRDRDLAAAVLSRRRCATTATTSPTTPTSTRTTARSRDFRDVRARGASARAAGDHRAGHQPHQRPAPVVRGVARQRATAPKRDWYVWSRRPTERYADARIIFTDTETSNWAWDQRGAAVLLASLLQPPAGPELRQPAGACAP